MDEGRQPLSRKLAIPSSKINPYRMIIIIRLVVLGFFFHYRVMHPVENAYALWLVSVICEIWFTLSWILDQFPKWLPVMRETYLDRLSLRQVIYKQKCQQHTLWHAFFNTIYDWSKFTWVPLLWECVPPNRVRAHMNSIQSQRVCWKECARKCVTSTPHLQIVWW